MNKSIKYYSFPDQIASYEAEINKPFIAAANATPVTDAVAEAVIPAVSAGSEVAANTTEPVVDENPLFEYDFVYTEDGYQKDVIYIHGYNGTDPVVTFPSQVDGYTVETIDVAFNVPVTDVTVAEGIKHIQRIDTDRISGDVKVTITLPSTLETLGKEAFWYTDKVVKVVMPSAVTIEENAFDHCEALTDFALPSNVVSIGDYAFSNCKNLTSITFPDSLTSIGGYAFYATGITSVVLPKTVTTLFDGIFADCKSLQSVSIPGVTMMGSSVFSDCTSLSEITLPEGLLIIGDNAFYGCESLTSIILPESLINTGSYVFANCTALKNVTLPKNMTRIQYNMFSWCSALT